MALMKSAPSWIVKRQVERMHLGFRAAYYRRLARKQTEAAAAAVQAAGEAGDAGGSPTKRELRKRK